MDQKFAGFSCPQRRCRVMSCLALSPTGWPLASLALSLSAYRTDHKMFADLCDLDALVQGWPLALKPSFADVDLERPDSIAHSGARGIFQLNSRFSQGGASGLKK